MRGDGSGTRMVVEGDMEVIRLAVYSKVNSGQDCSRIGWELLTLWPEELTSAPFGRRVHVDWRDKNRILSRHSRCTRYNWIFD